MPHAQPGLSILTFFFFWLHLVACGILVPRPGIEPAPPTSRLSSFFFKYMYLFIWLHWVFVAVRRLSLVVASGGYSLLRCAGFSLWWLLLLWNTGSRRVGSVVVARGP